MNDDTKYIIANIDKLTPYSSKTTRIEANKLYYDTLQNVEITQDGIESFCLIKSFEISEGNVYVKYYVTDTGEFIRYVCKQEVGTIDEDEEFVGLDIDTCDE